MDKYIVKTFNKDFSNSLENERNSNCDANCEMILNENLVYEDEDEEYDLPNIIQNLDSENDVKNNTVILKKKEEENLTTVEFKLEGETEVTQYSFGEFYLNTFLNCDKFIINEKQYCIKEKIYKFRDEDIEEEDVLILMCDLCE